MTRKQLLETARRTDFHEEVGLIDEINELFDDIESRTCKNCKHGAKYDGEVFQCIPMYNALGGIETFTASTFGCNEFERRWGD